MTLIQTEPKSIKIGTTNIKRVTIRPNGQEKQIRPVGWTPGANTMIYYDFDNNINDQSGNNRDATSGGTISYGTTSDGASYINLENGYLTLPNLTYSNPFTMLIWSKQNDTTGGSNIWDLSNGSSMMLRVAGGVIYSDFPSYSPYTWTEENKWELIVATFDSTAIKYYINGSLGATKSPRAQSYTSAGSKLGTEWNRTTENNRKLYIGSFIVENQAWSATDISDYYNQTKANYGL